MNKFADLDNLEFSALFTGYKQKKVSATNKCNKNIEILSNPPQSIDWSDKKAVGPVRNQGSCGSCWAFSAVGAIEGLDAIKNGNINTYSPQQLVDCAGGSYENEGCNGG
jgi:C1A family cysteine protease